MIRPPSVFPALAFLLLAGEQGWASKPDTWPLKSLVLPGRGTVVVRYGPKALAEYGARDGKLVRVFDAGATPNAFDASADERALAVLGSDLSVTLWDLRTGARRWRAEPLKGREYYMPSDISFAHDGASLVVAVDAVVVYDARTGAVRRSITADFLHARSVALSPDGKAGLALSWGGGASSGDDLWSFDVATGKAANTGRHGFRTVRYASGGKHAACPAGWPDKEEGWLRVIALAEGYPTKPVGDFLWVRYLKPTGDGGFYYDVLYKDLGSGGWRYDPRTGKERELWRMDKAKGVVTGGASCPELMVSVSTDYRYVTTVTDLRTWKAVKIDNSARYKAEWLSGSSNPNNRKPGDEPAPPDAAVVTDTGEPSVEGREVVASSDEGGGRGWWAAGALSTLAAAGIAGWALWRRRRAAPPAAP